MDYNIITKKIHKDWNVFMENNEDELKNILEQIYQNNTDTIYPKQKHIFRSLFYFSPMEIKLVILGQDPYINGEAHGLAFSIPKKHKKIPPSLKNIFKEIKNSYPDYTIPSNGSLLRWVKEEKILLLNSALTVIKGKSNSMMKIWQDYTDKLINFISETNNHTVFLLMGNFAISKSKLINNTKHKIFTTKHPSPLSAHNGFFGSNIFKIINDYLDPNHNIFCK